MKILFSICVSLVALSSVAQTVVTNTKTGNHKQIPGTKFLLVPPTGFENAANFQGFQQMNTGASILVMEIPGPFSETTKGFNAEGLKSQGVILKQKEEIRMNGNPGLFLTTEQVAHGINYSKYILVFGDAKATYMVNGTFPKEIAELHKGIRESMLTVVYESNLTIDPSAAVSFSIDTDGTKLKFARSMTGTLLYTVDGKVPTESSDKTNFIVGLSLGNAPAIDKKSAAISRIKKLPYKELKLDENDITEIEVDGISGYELVGEGSDTKGMKELVYEVMLFTENGYYLMVGAARDNFDDNLELFRKLARTFKRK